MYKRQGFSEFIGSRNDAGLTFSDGVLKGRAMFVMDAQVATHFLLADDLGQMFIVDAKDSGIKIVTLTTVDKTRQYAEIICKDVPADLLELSGLSADSISKSIDAGRIMLAADTLGASQAMIDQAVDYSKERKQFGRAIGSFQAVKHMCCLLYTSDAADDSLRVDLGGRRIIKKTQKTVLVALFAAIL